MIVAMARSWIFVLAVLACFTAAAPAHASFPGRNGKIAYGWTGESTYRAGPTATSIRTVDPRSGRVRVLRDCPLTADPQPVHTDCSVGSPRWSPDGRRIAFLSTQIVIHPTDPWQFLPGIAHMAADGTGLESHRTGHSYGSLAWAPSGDRLLVQREISSTEYINPAGLFLVSPDGTELRQAGPVLSTFGDWSSRGQIAYVRDRNPDPEGCARICQDVFLTRLGGTPRRLTYRGGGFPSWSPRGTRLAFFRAREDGRGASIYLVRRDGSGLRRLTSGYAPTWSPDGKWIAFIRGGDLFVIRTNGRDRRRLVDSPRVAGEGPGVSSIDWQPLARG
jgi:Tol biopolymer transport system component